MARTDAPSQWPYLAIYGVLSAAAVYYMRLGPVSKISGDYLEPLFARPSKFTYPGRSIVIRQDYTGVKAIDGLLAMLVTAFLAGPARLDPRVTVQQINFLSSWTSVLVVWSIESARSGGWRAATFTSLWALLYQTIGGAVIIPLYLILFTLYPPTGPVPIAKVKSLIPAVILGYLVPTIAMYTQWGNMDWTMIATAIWQPSPILVNILWMPLAAVSSKTGNSLQSIEVLHLLAGTVSAASHFITLFLCFSDYRAITFASVFAPQGSDINTFIEAVHFIFQIDYLIIFIATTVWCIQEVNKVKSVASSVLVLLGTALIGPAATLSAVWFWREGRVQKHTKAKTL